MQQTALRKHSRCSLYVQLFNPRTRLVAEHNGPFLPGVYLSYKRNISEAISITSCPLSDSLHKTGLTADVYGEAFEYNKNYLIPYVVEFDF